MFYKGLHCPLKKIFNKNLILLADFEKEGVKVVTVITNDEKSAGLSIIYGELKELYFGYNFDLKIVNNCRLFISKGINERDSDVFREPGMLLIDKNNDI